MADYDVSDMSCSACDAPATHTRFVVTLADRELDVWEPVCDACDRGDDVDLSPYL